MPQKGSVCRHSEKHCSEHCWYEDLLLLPLPSLCFRGTRGRNVYCVLVKDIKPGSDLGEILQRSQKDCLDFAYVYGFKSLRTRADRGRILGNLYGSVSCCECGGGLCRTQIQSLLRAKEACSMSCLRNGNTTLPSQLPTPGTGSKLALKSRAVIRHFCFCYFILAFFLLAWRAKRYNLYFNSLDFFSSHWSKLGNGRLFCILLQAQTHGVVLFCIVSIVFFPMLVMRTAFLALLTQHAFVIGFQ